VNSRDSVVIVVAVSIVGAFVIGIVSAVSLLVS
jgi:hypothetical protein